MEKRENITKDGFEYLKQDHQRIQEIYENCLECDARYLMQKQHCVQDWIRELSLHDMAETQFLYPATRRLLGHSGRKLADQQTEEHRSFRRQLHHLENSPITSETIPNINRQMEHIMSDLKPHMKQEEEELFPALRSQMSSQDIEGFQVGMEWTKHFAPTHPHPYAPDTPPGVYVAGPAVGVMDKTSDAFNRATGKQ